MDHDILGGQRSTDLGVIRINNEVITSIAAIAALEVKGVYKMGGGFKKTLYDIVTGKGDSKGVRIRMKEAEAWLVVSIVVEYGVDIPHVADEVQEKVKNVVERMTGLILSKVDVVVEGVQTKPKAGA